jgi:hypothetical protein
MRILNLGCGVQSTTLFLMAHEGIIPPIDHAIFADTQDEPEAVYQHLAWLRTVPAPVPLIHVGTIGRLGDHLLAGTKGAGQRKRHKIGLDGTDRFASIPAFTKSPGDEKEGRTRRQCTKEYKIEVVERIIRRTIFGLKPRQRMPSKVVVKQLFGISWDEGKRSIKIRCRLEKTGWSRGEFPLIDMGMTRADCQEWLKSRVPHETPRSACVFCPFRQPDEWEQLKKNPADWHRAVEVDAGLRSEGAAANRGLAAALYVHRQCVPLPMVDFAADLAKAEKKKAKIAERMAMPLFEQHQCEDGMCGL